MTPGIPYQGKDDLTNFILGRFTLYERQKKIALLPKLNACHDMMNRKLDPRTKLWKSGEASGWRSDIVLAVARIKVFAAYVTLLDIFLQGGDIPFSLKESPFHRFEQPGEGKDLERIIADMEARIREQHRLRRQDRQYMKKIFALCAYGMAVSRYSVDPVEVNTFAKREEAPGYGSISPVLSYEEAHEIVDTPGHDNVSVWNFFWDMENDDLQKGTGVIERDFISPYDLRKYLRDPAYIASQAEIAHSEAQGKRGQSGASQEEQEALDPRLRDLEDRKNTVRRIRFWGRVPRYALEVFENEKLNGPTPRTDDELGDDSGDDIGVFATVTDSTIVRLKRLPPFTRRPYKLCYLEDAVDDVVPSGVADNVSPVQTILTGLVRAFLDNKNLSSNVLLAVKSMFFANPAQLDEPVEPGSMFEISASCDDARKALSQIQIQDTGQSLLDAIGIFDRWKDTTSHIPEFLQGSTLPKQKADTAYEMSQLQENAGRYLGMAFKNIDESFVEPEVEDIYRFNMLDPDYKGEKALCSVTAMGLPSFRDKVLRAQKMKELLALVLSDPSGQLLSEVKLRPHLEVIYRASDLDPADFLKSDEEKAQEAQAAQEAQDRQQQVAVDRVKQAEIEGEQFKSDAKAKTTAIKEQAKAETQSRLADEAFKRELVMEGVRSIGGIGAKGGPNESRQ